MWGLILTIQSSHSFHKFHRHRFFVLLIVGCLFNSGPSQVSYSSHYKATKRKLLVQPQAPHKLLMIIKAKFCNKKVFLFWPRPDWYDYFVQTFENINITRGLSSSYRLWFIIPFDFFFHGHRQLMWVAIHFVFGELFYKSDGWSWLTPWVILIEIFGKDLLSTWHCNPDWVANSKEQRSQSIQLSISP